MDILILFRQTLKLLHIIFNILSLKSNRYSSIFNILLRLSYKDFNVSLTFNFE
jgi:hypothetical protein